MTTDEKCYKLKMVLHNLLTVLDSHIVDTRFDQLVKELHKVTKKERPVNELLEQVLLYARHRLYAHPNSGISTVISPEDFKRLMKEF
jgi:fatty acid-binding protein DegV